MEDFLTEVLHLSQNATDLMLQSYVNLNWVHAVAWLLCSVWVLGHVFISASRASASLPDFPA